jgi:PAS domain S-box-containing protein
MNKKLQVLYVIFFCVALTGAALSVYGVSRWVLAAFFLAALCFATLALSHWMTYIRALVLKSNRALNTPESYRPKWSWRNLEKLEQNQDDVELKIHMSASLISNLMHPEKMQSVQILGLNDPIGNAIEGIKVEMQTIKEADEKRAWVTEGVARFGEILRNKTDVAEYANNIINNLVRYIGANQGGLFIEYKDEEDERYLELAACYAYGKRRFVENKFREGQGLIGQCMLERDFVYITDVPDTYIKITSGLGEATPRNVIVAPLISNDVFCGALELATFDILKPHQMEFLREVCKSIAAEIAALKTAEHTKKLLEASNNLTEELQSREEELKQNLDDLAAIQKEMSIKQSELTGIIHAIDATLATAELDTRGRIVKHNDILEQFLGYNSQQFMQRDFTTLTGADSDMPWAKILNGVIKSGDFKTRSAHGADVWLSITFTPVKDLQGYTVKLLSMIQNITQRKIKEKEFERLSLVTNNTDNSVIIADSNGVIEYVNEGFTKLTGFEPSEVIGRKPGQFLQGPLTDKKTIQKLREQLAAGIPIYEEILNYNKWKKTYWVSLAINPVKDERGNIQNFISIQSDITQTKIRALDFHQKMEALSRSNAIMEIDRNGLLLDINENYLEILGYKREELIGKPYTMLSRKDDTFRRLVDTIDEQGLQSGVFPRYDKKGERHAIKLMDYPVLDLNGQIQKIIEFGVDVSYEKRLEKEAERRQSELKSYLSGINNTIASAEFALDGSFRAANEIFLRLMGYTKADLQTKPFDALMGDDPAVIMMWENLRLGKFFSGEFKMKNKEGRELWLSGTFNPIIIEGDLPEKIMMFAQFTTQEKEKLNDLNTMVNALKSTLPVIEFNGEFMCKTANEKAMKIFGMSRMELRSKTVLDFIAPYYHAMWDKNKTEILTKDFSSFVLPFSIGGQVVPYEVSVSLARSLDGTVPKVIVLLVKEVNDQVPILAVVQ